MKPEAEVARRLGEAASRFRVPDPPVGPIVRRGRERWLLRATAITASTALIGSVLAWGIVSLAGLDTPSLPGTTGPSPTGPSEPVGQVLGPISRIPLPFPQSVSGDEGPAWVVSGSFPTLTLFRIDAATNEADAVLTGSVQGHAVGEGATWVSMCEGTESTESEGSGLCVESSVLKLDPVTGAQLGSTPIEGGIFWIDVGDGAVWVLSSVGNANLLHRIDPHDLSVEETLQMPVGRFVVGEGGVWADHLNGPAVLKIDPETGRSFDSFRLGDPCHMDTGFGSAWLGGCAPQSNTLFRIHARSLDVQAEFDISVEAGTVAVGGGAVWIAYRDGSGIRLRRIDPATNAVTEEPLFIDSEPKHPYLGAGPAPLGLAATDTELWITDVVADEVIKVDLLPRATDLVADWRQPGAAAAIDVGGRPIRRMAIGEDATWVIVQEGGTGQVILVRIDARTLEPVVVEVPGSAEGVAVGLGSTWVTVCTDRPADGDCNAGALVRMNPTTLVIESQESLGGSNFGVVGYGHGSVWVPTYDYGDQGFFLRRIDPETGEIEATIPGCCQDLVVDDTAVWALDGNGALLHIDPERNAVVAATPTQSLSLAEGEGAVWLPTADSTPSQSAIVRVDPSTHEVVARIVGPGFGSLAAGLGYVWTGEYQGDLIHLHRIDPASNEYLLDPYVVDPGPAQGSGVGQHGPPYVNLAIGADALWVGSETSFEVIRVQL